MPNMGFTIDVTVKNPEVLPEIQARFQNMEEVFNNIIDKWAQGNRRKFNKSRGAELAGVSLDSDVFWAPLTENYRKRKHKTVPNDWLMVSSGELMTAMTNPDTIGRAVTKTQAVFGAPISEAEQDKVSGNWSRRPVVFLDRTDTLAIKREIKDWLTLGPGYQDIKFAQGIQRVQAKREMKMWETEWQDRLYGS